MRSSSCHITSSVFQSIINSTDKQHPGNILKNASLISLTNKTGRWWWCFGYCRNYVFLRVHIWSKFLIHKSEVIQNVVRKYLRYHAGSENIHNIMLGTIVFKISWLVWTYHFPGCWTDWVHRRRIVSGEIGNKITSQICDVVSWQFFLEMLEIGINIQVYLLTKFFSSRSEPVESKSLTWRDAQTQESSLRRSWCTSAKTN